MRIRAGDVGSGRAMHPGMPIECDLRRAVTDYVGQRGDLAGPRLVLTRSQGRTSVTTEATSPRPPEPAAAELAGAGTAAGRSSTAQSSGTQAAGTQAAGTQAVEAQSATAQVATATPTATPGRREKPERRDKPERPAGTTARPAATKAAPARPPAV